MKTHNEIVDKIHELEELVKEFPYATLDEGYESANLVRQNMISQIILLQWVLKEDE